MRSKAVVLVSGGMDSATLLWKLSLEGWDVAGLSIHYGQRHVRELASAEALCRQLDVPHIDCDLGSVRDLLRGSSQTDDVAVPSGHYADPVMRVTVVPNRNMMLLAVAAAAAIGRGANVVAYAAHAGDHPVYPDCRPAFIDALRAALKLCHFDGGVELLAPFSNMSKTEIVTLGHLLGVPYELTYSCYAGREKHCGLCGTCTERRMAFEENGMRDPVEYEVPLEETQRTMQAG